MPSHEMLRFYWQIHYYNDYIIMNSIQWTLLKVLKIKYFIALYIPILILYI